MSSTIDKKELQKFSYTASQWWDENGPFSLLHKLNPIRLSYIREQINSNLDLLNSIKIAKNEINIEQPIKILDIGCGGGLLTVPLASIGYNVLGIDANTQNILSALEYANEIDYKNLKYLNYTVEQLERLLDANNPYSIRNDNLQKNKKSTQVLNLKDEITEIPKQFDVIVCSEVIEHVANKNLFMSSIFNLLKPNGILILSTINRTIKSYYQNIVFAEYIFRLLPRGTHQWKNFISPAEVISLLPNKMIKIIDISGIKYNIWNDKFSIVQNDNSTNYIMCLQRKNNSYK